MTLGFLLYAPILTWYFTIILGSPMLKLPSPRPP